MRLRRLSPNTEKAYLGWMRRFISSYGRCHPCQLSAREVSEFLTHLVVDVKVDNSTQNQALSGLLFLYQQVLGIELETWRASLGQERNDFLSSSPVTK